MQISQINMQNREWYLADLESTGKNTIETVEKSLTDMFIRLVRIYPCLYCDVLLATLRKAHQSKATQSKAIELSLYNQSTTMQNKT